MRILCVDDSRLTRLTLKKLLLHLQLPDLHILEAADGAAAVELFRTRNPDLMFLDLLMPEPDGMAVLAQLKQMAHGCFIAVLSSNIQQPVRERVIGELGADLFIEKPVNAEKLDRALSAFHRWKAGDGRC